MMLLINRLSFYFKLSPILFGSYQKTDYFCTRFEREALITEWHRIISPFKNWTIKNNSTYFPQTLASLKECITFAPRLRNNVSSKQTELLGRELLINNTKSLDK